jgi:hypothetical protein
VRLPAGRQVLAGLMSGVPVAWVTSVPVPEAGSIWRELSQLAPQTGLVPFLAASQAEDYHDNRPDTADPDEVARYWADRSLAREALLPWDLDDFGDPDDLSGVGELDPAALLADRWDDQMQHCDDDHEGWKAMNAPFGRAFPGLAPAEHRELDQAQLDAVLAGLRPARIGLAAAERPADVLSLTGWNGACNSFDGTVEIAAVLRSWEERFGAALLQVGFAEIQLLARRPPATTRAAQLLAAEHVAFCHGEGPYHQVTGIAGDLLKSPLWSFWWD